MLLLESNELRKLVGRIGYHQLIPSFEVSISFQRFLRKHQKEHARKKQEHRQYIFKFSQILADPNNIKEKNFQKQCKYPNKNKR